MTGIRKVNQLMERCDGHVKVLREVGQLSGTVTHSSGRCESC